MSNYVYDGSTDKVVFVVGDKALTSALSGKKELDSTLLGSADKTKVLAGDTEILFNSTSDKIVSLTGSVGESLTGQKELSGTLYGSKDNLVSLTGDAPFGWFHIYCDTTYKYTDNIDITCDRD